MPHPQNQDADHKNWDASGRTTDAPEAQGHAPEQLTAIQLALVSMGYTLVDAGQNDKPDGDGVDGQWSEGTQAAILQFQEDNGIEPTGLLDDETDEAILRAYGEALVASGAGDMFADGLDELQMGDSHGAVDAALQATSGTSIEDLAPGELPDEPVADALDDVSARITP